MKYIGQHILILICTALILTCRSNPAYSQTFFRNYSVKDGLSNNTVKAMVFDSDGYLWVGTEDGLNRYDGRQFHEFSDMVPGQDENFNEYVNSLLCTKDGTLWVGTNGGVFTKGYGEPYLRRFELTDEQGYPFVGEVLSISLDAKGRLWFSTSGSGIFRYTPTDSKITNYRTLQDGETLSYVPQAYADAVGNVWAIDRQGDNRLIHYDEVNDCFSSFDKENNFPDILCMCEDSYGNLWLGTWDEGVIKYNPRSRKMTRVMNASRKVVHVHSIVEYSRNVMAIGSDNGLCLWDDSARNYSIFNHLESSINSLSNDYVYPLIKDEEGGLWIGTYYGGVNYLSPFSQYIRHYEYAGGQSSVSGNIISAMCEDNAKRIWIGSDDGGVDCYDPETDSFIRPAGAALASLAGLNVHALCADEDRLWVGTYDGGLHLIDLRTGTSKVYRRGGAPDYADCNSSYSIYKDTHSNIWVGTMSGLLRYDRQTDSFRQILSGISLVIDIREDLYGDLWVATQGSGLYRYNHTDGSFTNYNARDGQLPGDQVNCILTDTGNDILIGTSKGIVRHSLVDGSFKAVEANLPSDNICFMVRNQGRVWVSTTTGLAYCLISDGTWHNFTSLEDSDGSAYLVGSGLVSGGNELYLGTTKGFNVMPLSRIVMNEVSPKVGISSIKSGDSIDYGPDEIATLMAGPASVRLKTSDRGVSFTLYSTSYVNPSKNGFSYMMEGFDKEWQNSSDPDVVYGKMSPGNYTFRVRGTNNDGVWNTADTVLKVRVRAQWFLSRFSIFLYVLVFFSLIFISIVYYYRHKDMMRKERLAELQRQKETDMYQEKLKFFTMVAHEIRTPASLILGPLENALELEQSDEMRKNLNVISKNCHSMLDMINQLLDYKKVENGAFAIRYSIFNFNEAVNQILSAYAVSASGGHIRFSQSCEGLPSGLTVKMDRGALERILNNMLTNAFKYCKSSVRVECVYDKAADRVSISIKDDGVGISKDNISNIFKPFFRENEFNRTGTGIGLFLVKHLVDSHGGTVDVKSEKNVGSEFVVTLPARSSECAGTDSLVLVGEEGLKAPAVEAENGRKECILVVEDNPELRTFLESNLKEDYDVLLAGDGQEAVKVLHNSNVNLIISDVMMPVMDGLELCRYVHSHATIAHIPIILLTAKTDMDTRMEGLESRADVFMEKPFSLKMLRTQVRNLLQSREMLRKKFSSYFLAPYDDNAANAKNKEADPFWKKLNGFMEANIDNPDYSVNRLAEDMCMSRTKLFAHFKEVSDRTPMELMQHYRLKKAASLLLGGNYKISEVAYMVGFKDPSYFTKCFTKQFGMTPALFAQRASESGGR